MDINRLLDKAKIKLINKKNSCFLSTVLFSLKFKWDESCPTAYTDGLSIGINPEFFKSLTGEVRASLLAHETWHVCFMHMLRCGSKNPRKYNVAADYVINNMLKDNGFDIGDGWLLDAKYKGMSTEEIYDLLPDSEDGEDNPQNGDFGKPESGESNSGGGGEQGQQTPEQVDRDLKAKIEAVMVKASVQAQMSGEGVSGMPDNIRRRLDEILNPKLDWRVIFQNYMNGFANEDFSFQRPKRRFMPDYYMPSLYSESMDEMAFAVDSSGSVSDDEFKQFIGEIVAAKEAHNPKQLTVIDFTTEVDTVHRIGRDENVQDLNFSGYGGTDLHCIFDFYKNEPPTVLVVFSDLYCSVVQEDPGYPVIWVCIDNPNAQVKFGELMHFSTKDFLRKQ